MAIDLNGIASWLHGWFPYHSEVVAKNQTSANASKNLVTDVDGEVSLENKISVGSGLSFDGNVENKINHSNSITAQTSTVLKKIKYDAQGHITGVADVSASDLTDTSAHSNIGTSANATQSTINTAIDTKLGEMVNINFITVVQSLPSASASTMGKIYLVAITGSGTNNYAEYVTVKKTSALGMTSYEWEKFGEVSGSGLSVDWADITSKPSTFTPSSHTHTESDITDLDIPTNTSDLTNDGSDGSSTYVETGDLPTVARTGNYTDLVDIPIEFTPSSHTHTESDITDLDIPTNTSDLVNDGSDGSSSYLESEDLADVALSGDFTDLQNIPSSFSPSLHSHGVITSDGKIGTNANKIITTGTDGVLQASNTIPVIQVLDPNAHGSIGTNANTLQGGINIAINTAIGNLQTNKQDEITSIVLIPKTDNGSGKIVFYTGDEPT